LEAGEAVNSEDGCQKIEIPLSTGTFTNGGPGGMMRVFWKGLVFAIIGTIIGWCGPTHGEHNYDELNRENQYQIPIRA
jgi:hypothetical protein